MLLAAVLLGFSLTGCGGSQPTGSVTGSVTYRGQPVSQAEVVLYTKELVPAGAAVASGGEFRFERPVPVGDYAVAVVPFTEEVAGAEPRQSKPAGPAVPLLYHSGQTTKLTAHVTEGENKLELAIPQ